MHDRNNNNIFELQPGLPRALSDEEQADSVHNDEKENQIEFPNVLPVLPVRDLIIFNYTIMPLYVGREASIHAVEAALSSSKFMLVLTQKDENIAEPKQDDLHEIGTVVVVMRMLKLPDGRMKLLVQGVSRAKALEITQQKPFLEASIQPLQENDEFPQTVEVEAMIRTAKEQSERILSLRGLATPDVVGILSNVDHPGRLADLIASNLRLKLDEAQKLINCVDPVERLRLVNIHLAQEVELAVMQAQIQEKAKEGIDKAQKDYFLREQLKAIRKELNEPSSSEEDDLAELAEALQKAKLPETAQKEADRNMKRLASMHAESSEASVVRNYLEWLAELPWQKTSKDRLDIIKAEDILNEDHFGLEKVKERILEFLSIRKLNPKSKSPILCFVGPPGVGKTSLGRSIARAMGRKFQRMSVGGMRDEAEIRGHRRTYVGALPGRIIQSLKTVGTRNPVIMLDEVDKIGSDYRGDPSSALLEVLDPEQNFSFSDHYLNVPFDLSKVMFICTANHLETIPKPLLDRMEIIRIPGYTMQEKMEIAKKYLFARQVKENGLRPKDISMDESVFETVITEYTQEAGVRNLEREIGAICRKIARKKASGEKPPFTVTVNIVHELLGAPRFLDEEIDANPVPGIAMGLAWTPHGGELLHIEVSTMQGKGNIQLTGQLGDVMKESAQAALSYARSHAEDWRIAPDFSQHTDIHIHVPAGATPKDGPSAGVTIATALFSALTGTPVAKGLCMTGEITLRGKILPVGGIKEKILAAVARGRTDVLIPKQNKKDLEDIPAELIKKIRIHPVESLEEALAFAFPRVLKKRTKKSA